MKLVIVVKWYPPDLKVPARRWGNLVRYLQACGAECTVVAAGSGGSIESTMGTAGENVIRLPISDSEPSSESVVKRPTAPSLRQKAGRALLRVSPPILRDHRVLRWISHGRSSQLIDVAASSTCVISSYGPLGPLVMGRQLAVSAGKPWIADIRDSFESRDGFASPFARRLSRRLEGALLRTAAVRVTIGNRLADYLSSRYGAAFAAIYNGWTETDLVERRAGPNQEAFLYYAGSIYTHQLPALELLLHALRQVDGVRLRVRLLKDNTRGELSRLLNRTEFKGVTEVLPAVLPEVVREELACSIGAVVLEDLHGRSDLANATVTGKLLGLLASGAPGIAISSKLGEVSSIAGMVPNWHAVATMPDAIAAIVALTTRIHAQSTSEVMNEYHASRQASKLLDLIASLRCTQAS